MQVNYIKHLESIHSAFVEDSRITPFHVSLYMALFHQWNSAMFPEQLSIARSEIMRYAKLGSVNTYTKCLKELHAFNYLNYVPSKNPYVGSLINMYRFDNSSSNSSDHSTCLKTDNSCDNTNETVVRPYINSINNKKQLNITNIDEADSKIEQQQNLKKIKFLPPSLEEVILFFKEKNKTDLEAEKFFNHFESNGWLVGGKSKMKNWQAAARNWILNSEKFANSSKGPPKPGHLNVNQNKDYSIPL